MPRKQSGPAAADAFNFFTAGQLDKAVLDLRYLIPGLLAAGEPTILAGPGKSLRTSLALDLASSLAGGGKFLGHFQAAEPARVAYLCDGGLADVQERLRRIAGARDTTLDQLSDGLLVADWLPQLDNAQHLLSLGTWLSDRAVKLLVLDPAARCLPAAAVDNVFTAGRLLGELAAVCRRAGATLLLVGDASRNIEERLHAPLELANVAAGFRGFARQWLVLGRREEYEPNSGKHKLWLRVGASAGHGGLWAVNVREGDAGNRRWMVAIRDGAELTGRQPGEEDAKTLRRRRADAKAILAALAATPDGTNVSALWQRSGVQYARMVEAVKSLCASGRVERCASGKDGTLLGVRLRKTEGPQTAGELAEVEATIARNKAQQEAPRQARRAMILTALADMPEGADATALIEKLKLTSVARKDLEKLVAEGIVVRCQVAVGNQVRPGFRLAIIGSGGLPDAAAKRVLERQHAANRARVMEALAQVPAGEVKSNLAPRAGLSLPKTSVVLQDLLRAGQVEQCQIVTSQGHTAKGYKLAQGGGQEADGNGQTAQDVT
jgi:biotin carboxyl carrier protein